MKSLFVFSACVAITGAAIAAGVPGNNTAVIIRKAPVESDTGYQFLCVPVRGFDITGQGKAKGVPLDDVLPPASLSEQATLMVQANGEGGEGSVAQGTYNIVNNVWALQGGSQAGDGASVGEQALNNGALIWLAANGAVATGPFATASTDVGETPETVFCGEEVPLAEGACLIDTPEVGINSYGNNTSSDIDIVTNLIAEPKEGDQLMRVTAGQRDYLYYLYFNNGGWFVVTIPASGSSQLSLRAVGDELRTIPPGEAFYYSRAK